MLFPEALGWDQTGIGPLGLVLPPPAACVCPAISVHFVFLELCTVEIRESSCHGFGTASILVIKGVQGHV